MCKSYNSLEYSNLACNIHPFGLSLVNSTKSNCLNNPFSINSKLPVRRGYTLQYTLLASPYITYFDGSLLS